MIPSFKASDSQHRALYFCLRVKAWACRNPSFITIFFQRYQFLLSHLFPPFAFESSSVFSISPWHQTRSTELYIFASASRLGRAAIQVSSQFSSKGINFCYLIFSPLSPLNRALSFQYHHGIRLAAPSFIFLPPRQGLGVPQSKFHYSFLPKGSTSANSSFPPFRL